MGNLQHISPGAEIHWAYEKPSSGYFDFHARKFERLAQEEAKRVEWWQARYDACKSIAADPQHSPEIRAEAEIEAGYIEKWQLSFQRRYLEQLLQSFRDFRSMAEQAQRFEARWSFNPYRDPLRDRLKEHNRQALENYAKDFAKYGAKKRRRRKASR